MKKGAPKHISDKDIYCFCQPLSKKPNKNLAFFGLAFIACIINLKTTHLSPNTTLVTTSRKKDIILPLCSIDQVHEGRWVSKILQPNEIPYRTKHELSFCVVSSNKESNNSYYEGGTYYRRNGTIQSFEWIPHSSHSCSFEKWSTVSFCRALKNDTAVKSNEMNNNDTYAGASPSDVDILVMGDSLMQEQHKSLLHLVNGPHGVHFGLDAYHRMTHKSGIQMIFRRLDYYGDKPDLLSWELSNKNPTYAVINFGAHYLPDPTHGSAIQSISNDVREWQNRCKLQNKECLMIWRTTVPGHPSCSSQKYEYPNFLNWTLPYAEKILVENRPPFHWKEFGHQNKNALEIFQASGIDFMVMDAYKLNILRPDGHLIFGGKRDCLHSCLGSKIDVYSQLLLHIIKLHKQQGLSITK